MANEEEIIALVTSVVVAVGVLVRYIFTYVKKSQCVVEGGKTSVTVV